MPFYLSLGLSVSANPTSLQAQCLGKKCFHMKRAENIDRNGCDAAKLSYLLLNRAYLPQFRLWNIHFHSDKLHFNDSSNSNDPVYDLWLKYYVLVLCHATHTPHIYDCCCCCCCCRCYFQFIQRMHYACVDKLRYIRWRFSILFFRVFIYFSLLLVLSLDSALYSTLYTIIIKCDRVHPTKVFWFVARRTAKSLHTHTRDIMMVERKYIVYCVEKLEHVCHR